MLNDESNQNNDEFEMEFLTFAKAELVRLMKMNLDSDKMIRERVKVEMNKFLYEVLKEVCYELNKYPYTTIEYEMFEEAVYPYTNIRKVNEEKRRIIAHLDAIKADCDVLSAYVKKTLKIKDEEEDDFIPLAGRVKALRIIRDDEFR